MTNSSATWNLSVPKRCQRQRLDHQQHRADRLLRQLYAVNAGNNQPFTWDGKGNDGTQWPDGQYKMTATGTDTAGNTVAVSTQIQGVVSSVDLTQSPPLLSIDGQTYTVNQIKASPTDRFQPENEIMTWSRAIGS